MRTSPHLNCPKMLLTHLGDYEGHRQRKVVADKRGQQGYVSERRLQRSPSPLSLNSSTALRGGEAGILQSAGQVKSECAYRGNLTPNFTPLAERPIILPLFPDPFRTRASFPDFAVVSFDCS